LGAEKAVTAQRIPVVLRERRSERSGKEENVYNARNEAREELKRERLAAGLMSDRFPNVSSIVVTMTYNRAPAASVFRTVHYCPTSPAFFRISCLGEGCEGGGLELTWVIQRMIREREKSMRGELRCENRDEAIPHADVDYSVAITYV
jgi:hypothetical protein